MDAKTLQRYRRRLIGIEKELVTLVIEVEDEIEQTAADDEIEAMDRVQADVLAQTLELLDDLERDQLEATEAALERIDAGTYGGCVDCGGEIPRARLDAVPWAERCEADQERFESGQRAHLERTGGRPRG